MGFEISIGEIVSGQTKGGVKYIRRNRAQIVETIKFETNRAAPVIEHNRSGLVGGHSNVASGSYGFWGRLGDEYPMLNPFMDRVEVGMSGDNKPVKLQTADIGAVAAAMKQIRMQYPNAKPRMLTYGERSPLDYAEGDLAFLNWMHFWIYFSMGKYKDRAYVATN